MTPPWWAAFRPAEARIRCGPGEHVLRWADGRLSSAAHDDTEGELVLAALGGDKAECVAMLEAWGAHADDLDVLALGPRSPADELVVTWELVDQLRASFGPSPRSVPMRPGPAPAAYPAPGFGSRPGGPWPRARPIRGMPARRLSPDQERARARRTELLSLFALGQDFQQRLAAQVASAWSAGHARRASPRAGPRTAGTGRRAERAARPGGRAVARPRPGRGPGHPARGSRLGQRRAGWDRSPGRAPAQLAGPGLGSGFPGRGRPPDRRCAGGELAAGAGARAPGARDGTRRPEHSARR